MLLFLQFQFSYVEFPPILVTFPETTTGLVLQVMSLWGTRCLKSLKRTD